MATRVKCREVRKLLHSMPECDCEETLRLVSEHVSRCTACGELHAGLERMEKVLIGSRLRVKEIVHDSRIRQSRILKEMRGPRKKRAWSLSPAWAGVAAVVLVIGASAALLLGGGGVRKTNDLGAPLATKASTDTAPSDTLGELAEVACRHQAPSLDLPYTPDVFAHDSFFSTSLEPYLQPQDTLRTIAESATHLIRRKET